MSHVVIGSQAGFHTLMPVLFCNNFGNPKKIWEIINRLTGRINKSIDDIIMNSFQLKPK